MEAELKPADGGPADAGDAKASSEDVEPAAGSGSVPEVPQVQVSEPPATTCEPLTQTSEEPPPQHGEQSEGKGGRRRGAHFPDVSRRARRWIDN